MNRIFVIFTLVACLFIGSFLRLYRLTDVPSGFLQDEAAAGYDAYAILKTGRDHHGARMPITFQTFNDWTGHFFNYQLIPFVAIFGLNIFSIRFAVAFLSIVSIILIYLFGIELTGDKTISLLMVFLFSLSQFSVMNSRWAVQPNTVVFFFTLSLLLFITGINRIRKRRLWWFVAGIVFGFTLYTYPSIEGFLPIWLLGSLAIVYWGDRRKDGNSRLLKDMGILILMFSIVAGPLVLDHVKKPQTITTKLGMVSVASQAKEPLVVYLKNYISYYLPNFLFLGKEVNPTRAVPGFGYENAFLGVFYYLGILFLIFKREYLMKRYQLFDSAKIKIIYWFMIIFPAVPSLTVPPGDFQRAIYILPIMIFFVSMGFVCVFEIVKTVSFYSLDKHIVIIGLGIFSVYLYLQYGFFRSYFGPKYKAVAQWYFQNGIEKIVNFTSINENKYKSIVIDSTINQPYIYVLFYKRVNPETLNYDDFSSIDSNTNWLSVKKYKSYLFRKITNKDIQEANLVKTIFNSPFSVYTIYEKEDKLIVKFQMTNRDFK